MDNLPDRKGLRLAILHAIRQDEQICIKQCLKSIRLTTEQRTAIQKEARKLIKTIQSTRRKMGGIDALMVQYHLSQAEGITLMCLAEALLRIPDKATIYDMIQDRLTSGDWLSHYGKSHSLFVNAATWGLILTKKLLHKPSNAHLVDTLQHVTQRLGKPVIARIVLNMMQQLGDQFVMGSDMTQALKRSKNKQAKHYRYSYDMLGEAAHTAPDAKRYFDDYQNAITALGQVKSPNDDMLVRPGISIKLSALHPRYEITTYDQCYETLSARVLKLAQMAAQANITLTIDAEEADRLDLSLDIVRYVFTHPSLQQWQGFGLAVQAYQKASYDVIEWLINLAKKQEKQIMIRLVKGAYWDTEIKDTQQRGLHDYPVFTRKANTDVSYLAAAQQIINAGSWVYPQFATHNAMTVMAIITMLGDRKDFEFQCLHGMGQTMYNALFDTHDANWACRIYAPVGKHEDLLPYLVRRLLENGANSSFVNQIMNHDIDLDQLTQDPIHEVANHQHHRHPKIPLPSGLYGNSRKNSHGFDLSNLHVIQTLNRKMLSQMNPHYVITPSHLDSENKQVRTKINLQNPATHQPLGQLQLANKSDVLKAIKICHDFQPTWQGYGVEHRCAILLRCADLLEEKITYFMMLAIKEAGKTWQDAIDEVREAVDFLRYYAQQAKSNLMPKAMPGPTGESNVVYLQGRGVAACISPWNFPLAIFTGQIAAALVSGNTVIAKPANQTTIIAYEMIALFHQAGLDRDALAFMPGDSQAVGQTLIEHPFIALVMLTGSNQTAKTIAQNLVKRPGGIIPLIAETGGQNALIVDSTALPEQVVTDVITSAFKSAGQRCSACRVLFLQQDVADKIITMLAGAMAELTGGDPWDISHDFGPVIDAQSRQRLIEHQKHLNKIGTCIYQCKLPSDITNQGTYFEPAAYEINSIDQLKEEVFGPILHVIRFEKNDIQTVIDSINHTGFGLTFGIHSRIQSHINTIIANIKSGNIYVNRNIVGAVVGTQPFGGEGLSGTGPKAGGEQYLLRLCKERTVTINTAAIGGNASLMTLSEDD